MYFLPEEQAPEWMAKAVEGTEDHADILVQAAAAGLVYRLYRPEEPALKRRLPEPTLRAIEVRNNLLWQELDFAMAYECQELTASLYDICRFVRQGKQAAAGDLAVYMTARRDMLESLYAIGGGHVGSEFSRDDLRRLDERIEREIVSVHTALRWAGRLPLPKGHLRAIQEHEPESWWGFILPPQSAAEWTRKSLAFWRSSSPHEIWEACCPEKPFGPEEEARVVAGPAAFFGSLNPAQRARFMALGEESDNGIDHQQPKREEP